MANESETAFCALHVLSHSRSRFLVINRKNIFCGALGWILTVLLFQIDFIVVSMFSNINEPWLEKYVCAFVDDINAEKREKIAMLY